MSAPIPTILHAATLPLRGARLFLRRQIRRRQPPGAVPGQIVVDPEAPKPRLRYMLYDRGSLVEQEVPTAEGLAQAREAGKVLWVQVEGLGDKAVLESLQTGFNLHRLAMEDVVNVPQRAKVDDYEEHVYIVLHVALAAEQCRTEQVSLFITDGLVITFQESQDGFLDPIRERVRRNLGVLRSRGADYLSYAIVDLLIDSYFPLLERLGDQIDEVEEMVLRAPTNKTLRRLYDIKRDLLSVRRLLWPLRDVMSSLIRDHPDELDDETILHYRDCYDHTIRLIDHVEVLRELAADISNLQLAKLSNRTNEIMKVLTLIGAIFIPLNFIAAVYGMNFNTELSPWNMPELDWYLGYPFALLVMTVVALGMYGYFRWKGWAGRSEGE